MAYTAKTTPEPRRESVLTLAQKLSNCRNRIERYEASLKQEKESEKQTLEILQSREFEVTELITNLQAIQETINTGKAISTSAPPKYSR